MKRLLISAAVLALVAGTPALAQNDHHGHGHGNGLGGGGGEMHGNPHGAGGGNPHGDFGSRGNFGRGEAMRGDQRDGGAAFRHQSAEEVFANHARGPGRWNNAQNRPRPNFMTEPAMNARAMRGVEHARRYENWRNYGSNYSAAANRNVPGRGAYGRNYANANGGHGLAGITPRNFEARRHFHVGSYQRPSGWYWHRWSYGEHLPRIFFASEYWIPDYVAFDLDAPPYGFVWVRYGDDALLVNRYTGDIIEVEYGLFA